MTDASWRRLSYSADVAGRFAAVADDPWSVWLDSGFPSGEGGRFDICACDPYLRIVSRDGVTELRDRRRLLERSSEAPLELLRRWLPRRDVRHPELPFVGGAVGYLSYEFGRRLMGLAPHRDSAWPELALGVYDRALVTDHLARRSWATDLRLDPSPRLSFGDWLARFGTGGALAVSSACLPTGHLRYDLPLADYRRGFARIMDYIRDGDCYQVNLTQRLRVPVSGDPWSTYLKLRTVSPVPYGAYLNFPGGRILSASPELFLDLRGNRVETRPIKGTRPRGATPAEDQALHDELRQSEKDRAENLMIVDLLRNDLGKHCVPGSIQVPALFAIERLSNVQHLVSGVTGTLAAGRDAFDLLSGCFPGGSITGAPKRRAMQIIDELEPVPREVYCGSIGWIGIDGDMSMNIAIRTLLHRDGEIGYWAGGGLVADSTAMDEYRETLDKAAPLFRTLGIAPEVGFDYSSQRSKK